MLTRRELLHRSALLSLSPLVPGFVSQTARAASPQRDERILVVIQLDGGNDGLNTVVPWRDENYARLRPKLKVDPQQLVRVNDELGLHPSMKRAGELYDQGRFTVIQGVGYPNPDRSHFRSMAIWQSARLPVSEHGQYGWLGRALDQVGALGAGPQSVFVGGGQLPVTLWSRRAQSAMFESFDALALSPSRELLQAAHAHASDDPPLVQAVSDVSRQAFATAEQLSHLATAETGPGDAAYPGSRLGQQLRLIASLLKSDCAARVYYAVQSGYDTHALQHASHWQLLQEFSSAVHRFLQDLAAVGLDDRVLVLAFSEFGRRAAENDSSGTDHGAAAPVFLAGPTLQSGIVGPNPDLGALVDGDVPMAIDFRQVYATILDRWLQVPAGEILGGDSEPLDLITA